MTLPGISLSGCPDHRLPHHLSLIVRTPTGAPLSGRRLVAALWGRGLAMSSGSACSSGRERGSAVLRAMGVPECDAASGLRISLGPWLSEKTLSNLPERLVPALAEAIEDLIASPTA